MKDLLYPLRVLHGRLHRRSRENRQLSEIKNRICTAEPDSVLFVLTPTHGNMGDHAIAAAVSDMLDELNLPYTEITAEELRLMERRKKMRLMNGRPVFINGGGNIGTLWPTVERIFRAIIRGCPRSPILCLPNTAFFEDSEKGRREYALSSRVYQSHKALTICAREEYSYELLKKMHSRVLLVPDMAMSLNECIEGTNRRGCVLCLRGDRERTRSEAADNAILEQVNKLFPGAVSYSDMNIGRPVPLEQREAELTNKYDVFRGAELVITDRLHGMVFAAVTGTPCIVIDSKSPKVRGCCEWIKDLEYIRFAESPGQITELYKAMPRSGCYTNEHLQPYYGMLKEYIASDMLRKA